MKYTKRVVSLFIIATMILSMLSAFIAVPVMAISAPEVWVDDTEAQSLENEPGIRIDMGDQIWVSGFGITAGEAVNVYWDFVQAAYLLNTTTAENDGSYGCYVDVPAAYNGTHYIWAKDLASGVSERSAHANGLNIWAKTSLDPSSALAEDPFEVSGSGFEAEADVEIIVWDGAISETLVEFADEESTDDDGSFALDLEIPDWDDDDYIVQVVDDDGNEANATLTIGPALVLSVTVGPVGTIVKAEGRGFTNNGDIYAEDNITLEGSSFPIDTKDGDDIGISSTGTLTAYIVIPWAPVGTYDVTFTDDVVSASDEFEIDGESSITVTPTYGTPGTVLTVKGYNFTRVSGTDVDLTLESQVAEASTDATGSFTATITVPPLDFGTRYNVTAFDERNCNGTDDVLVALIVLQLSDYSAPVGAAVTLMGSGFTAGEEYNATIGGIPLIETTDIAGVVTYFSHVWYVPSLPAGTYTINVRDIVEEIEVGIDFTVTDPAALSISRASIPNGYNLTIEGTNFVEKAGVSTQWWLYNSTDVWNLNDFPNVTVSTPGAAVPETSAEDDEEGTFTGYYLIPEFLKLGSYTINCTTTSNDATDPDVTQYAEVDIELVPEEVILNVGNPSYARGQTITFVIKATLKKDPFYLGIKDPEGSEYFNSTWTTADWKSIGAWFYIPSNLQIDDYISDVYSLPADAMAGTWTYSFWDADKEYANGTFTVTLLTEIEQLTQDIGDVATSVLDLGTSVSDLATSVEAVSGAAAEAAAAAATAAAAAADAKAAADGAAAAIADVGDTAEDALDAANDAKSAADAAKDAADSGLAAANDAKATAQTAADAANDAADAAEGAKDAASGLTTLVYGAIGASLIAALAAIVSLMQISRRIAG